jgi:hypothetical protein
MDNHMMATVADPLTLHYQVQLETKIDPLANDSVPPKANTCWTRNMKEKHTSRLKTWNGKWVKLIGCMLGNSWRRLVAAFLHVDVTRRRLRQLVRWSQLTYRTASEFMSHLSACRVMHAVTTRTFIYLFNFYIQPPQVSRLPSLIRPLSLGSILPHPLYLWRMTSWSSVYK